MSRRKSDEGSEEKKVSEHEMIPTRHENKPKGVPKYRDPDNPFNTWSGENRRPQWLNAQIDKGVKLEDMLIPGQPKPEPKLVKYLDPNNPDNTWSGVGRRPDWLRQKLESGSSLEDFEIR